jgi:hypothetical protein
LEGVFFLPPLPDGRNMENKLSTKEADRGGKNKKEKAS